MRHINKIQINNIGYNSAQNYYAALKKGFLDSCKHKEDHQFYDYLTNYMNNQENKAWGEFSKVKTGTDKIQKAFKKISEKIAENVPELAVQELARLEHERKQKVDPQKIYLQLILQELQKPEYKMENKIKTIIKTTGTTDVQTLESLYTSYLTRYTYNLIGTINRIYELNKAAMAGYYHEQSEANLVKQLGEKIKIKSKGIGSKNLSIDIVLGQSGNYSLIKRGTQDLEKMVDTINNLRGNYNTTSKTTVESWGEIIKKQKLKTAGIQSKLYSINFDNPRAQGYGVGSNKELYDIFLDYSKSLNRNRKILISQALSAKFFGESALNIIQAFGENNIIFRTGNQRFFIDDLINHLRKNNMALAFNFTQANHQLTYYIIMHKESALNNQIYYVKET